MGSGAFGNISVVGSAIGSLLAANNLNDVADIDTSLNNILPNQTGNNGKSLVTDGNNASWQNVVSTNQNFIFSPSGVASGNVFTDWGLLCAAIITLPNGVQPVITFTENFTIPTTDQPINGWDMRLGTWKSPLSQTGNVTLSLPDGVKINHLISIDQGLLVEASPTTNDGVFYHIGSSAWITQINNGAKLVNTGSKALILSPGSGTTIVFAINGATITIPPNDTAAWLKLSGGDSVLALQINATIFSQYPNNWIEGGNIGDALTYIASTAFVQPTLSGYTGDTPMVINNAYANNINYTPSIPANWDTVPGLVNTALDELAYQNALNIYKSILNSLTLGG